MKNIPYWSEEVCSGHFCVQDCEDGHCPWADEAMEAMEREAAKYDLDEIIAEVKGWG